MGGGYGRGGYGRMTERMGLGGRYGGSRGGYGGSYGGSYGGGPSFLPSPLPSDTPPPLTPLGPNRRQRWPRRVRLLSRPVRGECASARRLLAHAPPSRRPSLRRRPPSSRASANMGIGGRAREGERSRSPRPKGRANTRPRGRAKARCGPWRLLSPAPSSFLLVLLLLDWVFGAPHHAIGTPPHTHPSCLCRPSPLSSSSSPVLSPSPPSSTYCQNMSS